MQIYSNSKDISCIYIKKIVKYGFDNIVYLLLYKTITYIYLYIET